MINPFETINDRLNNIEEMLKNLSAPQEPNDTKTPLDEYVQKKDVVGTLASASTLWKYENEGKLKVYGVGGKRFYKWTDIEGLFKEIKKG